MLATIVLIPDRYTCRGITFLPQQMTGSVPPGEYDVCEERDIEYSDLGILKTGRAVLLVNIATADKWYVGPNVAAFLLREHKRPNGPFPLDTWIASKFE